MKLSLRVKHGTDPAYTVDVAAATFIACERHYGKTMPAMFTDPSIEVLAWLAWEQTRKDGTTVTLFDQWFRDLEEIDAENDAAPLDGSQ